MGQEKSDSSIPFLGLVRQAFLPFSLKLSNSWGLGVGEEENTFFPFNAGGFLLIGIAALCFETGLVARVQRAHRLAVGGKCWWLGS